MRRFGRLRWAAIVALLLAGVASATTIRRMTLDDVTEAASEIVVGTVRSTVCVAGGGERDLIFTDVEFDGLDVWKGGAPGAKITYRFAGGSLNGRTLIVPGMPGYEVGHRYVLFANAAEDWICPTVGWWQGRYELRRDEATGAELLHDSDGHPVYGFAAGTPLLLPTKEHPRALTQTEFQVHVVRALEAAERRAEKERAAEEAKERAAEEKSASDDAADEPAPAGEER